MSSALPLRLLGRENGEFFVFDSRSHPVDHFDIISYRWGPEASPYRCGIDGVNWNITISKEKLEDIKRLMVSAEVQYLWVDSLCLDQDNTREKSAEIARMYEYYKNARNCHIMLDLPEIWDPQEIVDNLKFIDHVLSHMQGAALASDSRGLTENVIGRLSSWASKDWAFPMDKSMVRSAAIDMGVLNCYSTCIKHVKSLFDNEYFTRVWTFQEMILGKNVTMWGMNAGGVSCIGHLHTWMDLATDSKDKAYKLLIWIGGCRVLNTAGISAILRIIEEDNKSLNSLQTQVRGVSSARTDIINGGPFWWSDNYRGVSNIFSAVSITPRECKQRADIFRGLLGIFNGLFTPEEIERDLSGDDMEKISFTFFKQLSIKTRCAWTKLAISGGERGQWDWIPMVGRHSGSTTDDFFAGIVNLGQVKEKGQGKGQAKVQAMVGLQGVPRKYMKIFLRQGGTGFNFFFKGCNCGKKQKTGTFSSELIDTHDQPVIVNKDETGRRLVHCATVLGAIMNPGYDITQYRRRLLGKLAPHWNISDPSAKPVGWEDRCVSGTPWANVTHEWLKVHNMSMNYKMVDVTWCESRLANGSTGNISCEVQINCGCTIVAPFSLVFEAITSVEGSFLGDTTAWLDQDSRIVLRDGLGLVQVGDVGRAFSLVAFAGDVDYHRSFATSCRNTKSDKPAPIKLPWPMGRALVRDEFAHGLTDMARDYGYVETGGSGNLLICRNHPMDQYRILGVCIDGYIQSKKGYDNVTLR